MLPHPPNSPLFPYTTLFRSEWTVSVNYTYMHSSRLKTGGFSTSNWQRNLVPVGTDQFGRSILGADDGVVCPQTGELVFGDRKSTRLNSSHSSISYAVFCLKK